MESQNCIYVVDGEEATTNLALQLSTSIPADVRLYLSAEQFLQAYDRKTRGCAVAELQLPGMSGIDLQRRMADERIRLPLIFLTRRPDIRGVVQAMRGGAVSVLQKPLCERDFGSAIREALARDTDIRRMDAAHASLRRRFSGLSTRDRSILRLLVAGHPSSVIADELRIDVPTIDACVIDMLGKTQTATLLDLARLALQAELGSEDDQ
jgi:FixJ family two-component response regulator